MSKLSHNAGSLVAVVTPILSALLGTYVSIRVYEKRKSKGNKGVVIPCIAGTATAIGANLIGTAISGTLLITGNKQ